jgi:hypothetical protein
MLAMDVNDNAGCLNSRGVLTIFASMLAPTERQRDRETERQRDRETERQRDRETDRKTTPQDPQNNHNFGVSP